MFFPFAFDERSNTYLARFSDTLTQEDFAAFDVAALACRALHGPTAGLMDFSRVGEVRVSSAEMVCRGLQPQIMTGQPRAIVADGMLFGMMRMFGAYQSRDSVEPMIMRTLPEAYKALGLVAGDFHPIEVGTNIDVGSDAALGRELSVLYPLDRPGTS
jgi:hypothetical protein